MTLSADRFIQEVFLKVSLSTTSDTKGLLPVKSASAGNSQPTFLLKYNLPYFMQRSQSADLLLNRAVESVN
jgi:hypothetical protein